jgi:hypothetical protein
MTDPDRRTLEVAAKLATWIETEPLPSLLGLRVARVPELVLLKLDAGGRKSELDILELLDAQPQLDRDALRERAAVLGPEAALDHVLTSIRIPPSRFP